MVALLGFTSLTALPLRRAMGFRPTAEELADLIEEIDEDGSGAIEFPEFCVSTLKSGHGYRITGYYGGLD